MFFVYGSVVRSISEDYLDSRIVQVKVFGSVESTRSVVFDTRQSVKSYGWFRRYGSF